MISGSLGSIAGFGLRLGLNRWRRGILLSSWNLDGSKPRARGLGTRAPRISPLRMPRIVRFENLLLCAVTTARAPEILARLVSFTFVL
jgi:hypothetical protein